MSAKPSPAPARLAPPSVPPPTSEVAWFRQAKPYCNSVEVQTLSQHVPPAPATTTGAGYHAACFALAGRIADARQIIDRVRPGERAQAAGVVFDVGHPVADAGDDRSAGAIMELVIDYWPTNYMALYHAGMVEYMLGQRKLARRNLEEFLKYYQQPDGWTANARAVLKRLDSPVEAPLERLPDPR